MKGIVNKIIPFSNVDGPGNRLSIFFQGCNFDCLYCHNPETIEIMKEGNCSDDVTPMTVEEIMNEISEVAVLWTVTADFHFGLKKKGNL